MMRPLPICIVMFLLFGCSPSRTSTLWRVRDAALSPVSTTTFNDLNQKPVLTVSTQTIQKLLLAHIRITRTAGVQAELFITDGDDPNAFAGLVNQRRIIAVNIAMIKLIGDDMDEFAALLGHEAAHWAKGHVDSGISRSSTIQGIGTLIGAGLGLAGIPGAGYAIGLGANLVEAAYSRDDEREADAVGLDYMAANGFDAEGAIRLHEKLLKLPGGFNIPFLSTHPSSEERIENLKKLIAEKKSQLKQDPALNP
jgi:predicted Zn-dependent protease